MKSLKTIPMLVLIALAVVACDPTGPTLELDKMRDVRSAWPEARASIERAIDGEPTDPEVPPNFIFRLGEWDIAVNGLRIEETRTLRDRDWGTFRALSGESAVVKLGEELARL